MKSILLWQNLIIKNYVFKNLQIINKISNKEIKKNKNTKKDLNFNIDEKIVKNDIDKDIFNYQSNGEKTK